MVETAVGRQIYKTTHCLPLPRVFTLPNKWLTSYPTSFSYCVDMRTFSILLTVRFGCYITLESGNHQRPLAVIASYVGLCPLYSTDVMARTNCSFSPRYIKKNAILCFQLAVP